MSIIKVPTVLRSKLGEEATDGLVDLLTITQGQQEKRFVRVFKDSLALRIKYAEDRAADRYVLLDKKVDHLAEQAQGLDIRVQAIEQGVQNLNNRAQATENHMQVAADHVTTKIKASEEGLRKEMNLGFSEIQKQFTVQTRWIIAAGGFFVLILKTLNIAF